LDIGGGSEKSLFATAGARNDVFCLYTLLLVELSTGQSLYQNQVFVAERHVYKHCSDVLMTQYHCVAVSDL